MSFKPDCDCWMITPNKPEGSVFISKEPISDGWLFNASREIRHRHWGENDKHCPECGKPAKEVDGE